MKHYRNCFLIISLVIIHGTAFFAQGIRSAPLIWTVPAFPSKHDDVTVYFDASQGNGALAGFQGDVYAHTGVITSSSTGPSDWKHVIGNWGTADSRVKMTRVSDDLYSISYNITTFYDVPENEEVLKMAFVFRNVSGSIVERDTDGSDIYTNVSPNDTGLFISLISPSERDIIVSETDSILIDVLVSDTADLEIYDNENLFFTAHTDHASFYYHPSGSGNHTLRFTATNDSTITLEKKYLVLAQSITQLDPPAGILNGINYYSDTTYIFQVYAPLKQYAFLLTSANLFEPDTSFLMHVAEDGSTYWIELPRSLFSDGKNNYQYLFSGGIRVADPHSEVVLDPSNDGGISASVMSTLPPYPAGLTDGIVTAFDEAYQPFDFQVTDFTKPEKTKLVIYELLIRDFLANHSFNSLKDTLDYFQKLGVNAIELMPISEFEGNNSWGYNVSFHMAVDKYYGTREQLKEVIDAAHERGIAVIFDVVFNHTFSQGPLAQMYWDPVNQRPSAESPYLNVIPRHPFNVGSDFNHESPATKNWVKRILAYWLTEFKVDGFRFDLSKGLTQFNSGNDAGLMARYDAGRIAILKDYANKIWSIDPDAYVILEHFADNDEETELSNDGMMLWGNVNYQFSQAAKGLQSDLENVDYSFRNWNDPHLVGYMESHDEERVMYRILNEGDSEGDYNTRNPTTALKRVEAANAIFYSVPGPKMIWEFGELGYDYSINRCTNGTISNDCRLDPKPARWDYLQDWRRKEVWNVISSMIYLKENYPTFSSDDFEFNDANLFVKLVHLNHPDMDAVTIANFRVINSDINPKFQHTGTWYEYFTGDSLEVTDTQKKITFGPGEYRVYTSQPITPPLGYFTATHDITHQQATIYPSLVKGESIVHAVLENFDTIQSVTLSDLAGKVTRVEFNTSEDGLDIQLPESMVSGVYFVSIVTSGIHYNGKVVVQ